jgi:hypothetical protein
VTATWLEPAPGAPDSGDGRSRRALRLVGSGGASGPVETEERWDHAFPALPLTTVPDRGVRVPARKHVSRQVRRRRTLLAAMGLGLLALALPLSGTGGYSHPAGSAPAENVRPVVYTARPGDTLWTIAERLDPTGDPRPLVAQLEAQTGSDTVQTGERITVP